jgi:hypothetical protein
MDANQKDIASWRWVNRKAFPPILAINVGEDEIRGADQ